MKRYKVGIVYIGFKFDEPFECVYVDAPDAKTAINRALNHLKPNHMQTLTVREIPQTKKVY